MAEILVLVDHADGAVRKTTHELLTIARRLGEPSAVFIGVRHRDGARVAAGVRRGEDLRARRRRPRRTTWWRRKAEALAQLVEQARRPPCWCRRAGGQGDRGPAGGQDRLRADHRRGRRPGRGRTASVTTQSVFAGNFTVQARVTTGTPIVTVKPNSATPEQVEGARRGRGAVDVTVCEAAKARPGHRPRAARRRPGARAHRGRDRGVRRPRHRRRLRPGRGAGGRARRRGRRLPGRGRLRLVSAQLPGRPDRQDRLAAAVRRVRHLRRDPAPGRHADLEDDRRGQQGRGGADLRAGRLRRRRRPQAVLPQASEEVGRARADPRLRFRRVHLRNPHWPGVIAPGKCGVLLGSGPADGSVARRPDVRPVRRSRAAQTARPGRWPTSRPGRGSGPGTAPARGPGRSPRRCRRSSRSKSSGR